MRERERRAGRREKESCYDTPAGDKRFCSREDGLGWQGGLEGERDESRDVCRTRYLANKTTWRHTEGTGVAPFADR